MGIDDRVEQGIGQIVCARSSDAAAILPDAISHRFETIARALLKREHIALAEKQGELLAASRQFVHAHAGHDKEVIFVFVDLRSLVDIHHVLEGEAMDLE